MSRSPSELLAAAERKDGYRAACAASPLNAAARADQHYTPFSLAQEEVEMLLQEVDSIPLLSNSDIIILHPTADNGYPHTRPGRIVCMPASAVRGKTLGELSETLRHEAVHIHQRENESTWAAAAMRDGWQPCPPGQIPQRFRERCRLNPDTLKPQQFWAWRGRHVPLPLFLRDDYPTLGGVGIRWFDIETQATYTEPPGDFRQRYGPAPSQAEHPFELLAVESAAAGIRDERELVKWLNRLDGESGVRHGP
jgi:hypothetical protein